MNFQHTFQDGLALSSIASLYIIITFIINARIWLGDYPPDVQEMVPPKDEKEKRLSLILGIPFLVILLAVPVFSTLNLKGANPDLSYLHLAINAFGVALVFNIVDWLILDWLIFCTVTPKLIILPGSEGAAGYKDYWFHFRGFLIGTVISIVSGLVIGGIAMLF